MSRSQVFQHFEREVSEHQLTIIKDDGEYRHIRLSTPNNSCYYFDLVSWPGYLCMTGDMGTWTFSRIRDMFSFFRGEHGSINPAYWSERLEAGTGCPRGAIARTWDEQLFCRTLDERLEAWKESNKPEDYEDEDAYSVKLESVMDTITDLKNASGYEYEANAAYANAVDEEGILCDLWEDDFKSWSHHFLWACYAIVWGIQKYDTQKLAHRAADTFLACRVGDLK